jgi:cbb3-type cytochrome oxidase subunit 3
MPELQESLLERALRRLDSKPVAVGFTIGSAALAASLEYFTHLTVDHFAFSDDLHAALDASVMALMTLLLVGFTVAAFRERRRRVNEAIRSVADLNHHVRNALQVIRDAHYLPEDEQADAVLNSVDRIDSTLRRLFPNRIPPEWKKLMR